MNNTDGMFFITTNTTKYYIQQKNVYFFTLREQMFLKILKFP